MERADWLGLAVGVAIGGVYALLQVVEWRMGKSRGGGGLSGMFVGATVRLIVVLLAMLAALRMLEVNRFWLVGGLAVMVAIPLGWRLKRLMSKR
jgi:hypothetical protein